MNCFEWQSHVSDFLDGGLIGQTKREADTHLDQCKECNDRYKHYRIILTSIANQPRAALPVALRKSPLAAQLPRFDIYGRRSRWERFPWFVRAGIESLGIAFVILGVVAAVPRLRALYERSVQQKLDAFTLADLTSDLDSDRGEAPMPLARGIQPAAPDSADADAYDGEHEEDDTGDLKVGSSQIWRFNLKTDSPKELRAKILQTLIEAKVPANTPGIGGIEAPGGIQFDLLVSQDTVTNIKQALHKLSSQLPKQIAESSETGESFTWYKTKSKGKIPAGQSRVVIWLSQI